MGSAVDDVVRQHGSVEGPTSTISEWRLEQWKSSRLEQWFISIRDVPHMMDPCRHPSTSRRRYRGYMADGERQRLRSSLGAAAVAYAEHRPDYAEPALRWTFERAPGLRVLDLGAGTGKFTEGLVAMGADVIAVEPGPLMLAQLRHAIPTVSALAGSAEALPPPDAPVDAVLAGNAMHWFDIDVAGPEIARVLAPGGILAGLWNIFDNRIEWVAERARVGGSQAIGTRDTVTNWHHETAGMHLASGGTIAHFDMSE